MNEETLFNELASKPLSERKAFLDHVCAKEPKLRDTLEARLVTHDLSCSRQADLDETVDSETAKRTADSTKQYAPQPDRRSDYDETEPYARSADRDVPITHGAVIAGRYTLERKIGEGGMGEVWVANQTDPVKRRVAIKLIKAGMDSKTLLQRFEQERQALALMDHPHIAQILDGGLTSAHQPFFVMELVKGQPLTKFCDDAKLSTRRRLELFESICHAIQHAHQKGVIHRDLKPANILVTLVDGKPLPMIIDFGVSKATAGKLTDDTMATQFGAVVGTLEYMSPEQASLSSTDIDTRTDIYSMGVILHELLTGLRPLEIRSRKLSLPQMIRVIQEEEPSKPSTRLSENDSLDTVADARQADPGKLVAMLRGELDWVILKCLEKQRDRRYESVSGVARDIQQYLEDKPVEARPPSRGYRLRKFVKRHKVPVFAASVVLVSLIAGFIGTTLALQEARRQEGIALVENAAKEEALNSEREQRLLAQKHADLAERVLDTMTSELTEKAILTQNEVTEDQKNFLNEALRFYQELARSKPDGKDAWLRVAHAATRVAIIEMRLNRKQESAEGYRQASLMYAQLAADFPSNPDHRTNEAVNRHMLGQLLNDLGQKEEALNQYKLALELREKLAEEFPSHPEYGQAVVATKLSMVAVEDAIQGSKSSSNEVEDVLAEQERLVRQFPDNPGYRDVLAAGRANQSLDLMRQGKLDKALKQAHKALEIQVGLVTEKPAVRDYRQRLYRTHQYLGAIHMARQELDDGVSHYRNALDVQLKLVDDYPSVPQYRQELAVTRVNLGSTLIDLQKVDDGEQELREAARLLEKLVADLPKEMAYRQQLVTTCLNLSIILDNTGRNEEADGMTGRGLVHLEVFSQTSPAGSSSQREFFTRCIDLAKRLRIRNKLDECVDWLGKAIDMGAAIHDAFPDDSTIKQSLCNSHLDRAAVLVKLKRFADAIPDWEKAIALGSPKRQTAIRVGHALALARSGNIKDAVLRAKECREASDLGTSEYVELASVYALAQDDSDKANEYGDQAMELLRQAIGQPEFKDTDQLRNGDAFESLRKRDDFTMLLKQLEEL